MANPSTAHEPSMEEILASIRQIISEDGDEASTARSATAPAGRSAAEPQPEDDAPTGFEPLLGPETEPDGPAVAREEAEPDTAVGETMKPQSENTTRMTPQPAGSAQSSEATNRRQEQHFAAATPSTHVLRSGASGEERSLLSDNSGQAVSGAFSALAHTILAQNARTLEDLVAEMLRPMLKEWLDDNLPSLVERLVREEIERVSRGRR